MYKRLKCVLLLDCLCKAKARAGESHLHSIHACACSVTFENFPVRHPGGRLRANRVRAQFHDALAGLIRHVCMCVSVCVASLKVCKCMWLIYLCGGRLCTQNAYTETLNRELCTRLTAAWPDLSLKRVAHAHLAEGAVATWTRRRGREDAVTLFLQVTAEKQVYLVCTHVRCWVHRLYICVCVRVYV